VSTVVIGKFREESEHAGKSLTYEGGTYRIDDEAAVTLLQIKEADSRGELEWVDDRSRARHLGLTDDGSPPGAASAPLAGGEEKRPTGEQIRIVLYIAIGVLAALAMFVFAPANNEDQTATQEVGWIKVLSLSGSVSVVSEPLELKGAEQRVNLTGAPIDSGADAQATVRVVPVEPINGSTAPVPAGTIVAQGGSKAGDSLFLEAAPGRYRLEVVATNCEWSVSVWDKE